MAKSLINCRYCKKEFLADNGIIYNGFEMLLGGNC